MTVVLRSAEIAGTPRINDDAIANSRGCERWLLGVCVQLIHHPADIEKEWRALQRSGYASVFQSYEWISSLWGETAKAFGEEPLLFVGRQTDGSLAFIWPMALQRRLGGHILNWLGSWCSTANFGVYSAAAVRATPEIVRDWLLQVIRLRPDIGAIELTDQVAAWQSIPNPILRALPSRPSGECERVVLFENNFKTFYEARFSSDRRKRLRRYERKLAELGKVELRAAKDLDERRRWLDVFLTQKVAQLAHERSPTIFANPAVRSFLHDLAATETADFSLDILSMTIDDEVVGTRWGLAFKDRFYAYSTSIGDGPARQRSPGTLLTIANVAREFDKGARIYDFGPGPGEHKEIWSPVDAPLMTSWMMNKIAGLLPIAKSSLRDNMKRQLRARPKLLETWRRMRNTARGMMTNSPNESESV